MTAEEWIYIAVGLSLVAFFAVKYPSGKEEGGGIKRVGRWLRRVVYALMGMSWGIIKRVGRWFLRVFDTLMGMS